MRLSLAEARRLRGKRQKDLAEALGVTTQTYRKMELNPELVKIKDARIISEYLEIPLKNLQFTVSE